MDLSTAAADLFLGAACPGCGRPALALCAACATDITPDPRSVRVSDELVAAVSGEHDGVLRLAIVAWKEEGRASLLRPLAHLLAASVVEVLGDSATPLTLVPVPSSRRSRRARGCDVVDDLARCAAALLRATGTDVTVRQALVLVRQTADQTGLGARDRARNLRDALGLRTARGLAGRDVIVVDDIVTTGATLQEATRALAAAGHEPLAAAAMAHRP